MGGRGRGRGARSAGTKGKCLNRGKMGPDFHLTNCSEQPCGEKLERGQGQKQGRLVNSISVAKAKDDGGRGRGGDEKRSDWRQNLKALAH